MSPTPARPDNAARLASPEKLAGPERLAGIVSIAIGIAILALSVGSTAYALIEPEWIDRQLAAAGPILKDHPMFERPALTWIIVASGVIGVIESGLSIVLGGYVYRGRRWAIVTSILLMALRLIIVGLLFAVSLLGAVLVESDTTTVASTRSSLLYAGGCTLVLVGLLGLLIAALKPAKAHADMPVGEGGLNVG